MSGQTRDLNISFTPLSGAFRVRIEMESDWHIGSGTGRPSEVDRLLRRDGDGLPYVPAKTLTGIWRDACERVAYGLDYEEVQRGNPGQWSKWVSFLFGEQAGHPGEELQRKSPEDYEHPRPAMFSARSARFPEDLRQAIRSKSAVREAVTFIKPGVSISPRSGRAKTDYLRFEEMARVGAVLEANCEIDLSACENEDQNRAATALLVAGSGLVDRIGGKRRRGTGRCKLMIVGGPEMGDVLGWIERQNAPPDPPPPAGPSERVSLGKAAGGNWQCYDIVVTTKTPLIIAERAVGNLIKTLDYIPGAHLLAIISRRLGQLAAKAGVNLNEAIVNGDLMVTRATIEVDGEPGRPVPFCLFRDKLSGGLKGGEKVYNRFRDETEQKPQLKGYRSGYIGKTAAATLPAYRSVECEVETHNVVKDDIQRPHEDVGGVFSYQAIKAHTTLCAELRLRNSLVEKLTAYDRGWLGG